MDKAAMSAAEGRRAPASLPCCLRAPLQFFFYDLLSESDRYLEVVQKGGLVAGLVAAALIPISAIAHVAETGVSAASMLFCATVAVSSATWVACYVLTRRGSAAVHRTMTVGLLVDAIATVVSAFTSATQHVHVVLLLMLVCVGLFDLPKKWAWYVCLFPGYIVAAYNQTARSAVEFDFQPLFVDGATDGPLGLQSRMVPHVVQYVVFTVITAVVASMHAEFKRQLRRLHASCMLAQGVATQLAVYQTEEARVLLEAAAGPPPPGSPTMDSLKSDDQPDSDVCGADATLVDALETIVANLETFRPHLPNWMLDAAAQRAATDHALGTDWRTSDVSSNTANTGRHQTTASTAPDSSDGVASPWRGTQSPRADIGRARRVTVARARLGFRMFACADREQPADSNVPIPATTQGSSALLPNRSAAIADATNAFVDAVHAAARHTKAAVHSFIGDTVEVSWNAAAPVSTTAACCAAQFLARVRQSTTEINAGFDSGARSVHAAVGGGAVLFKARVQLAGTAVKRALLIGTSKRARDALSILAAHGAEHGAFLADTSIVADALDVDLRAVAVLNDSRIRRDNDRRNSNVVPPGTVDDPVHEADPAAPLTPPEAPEIARPHGKNAVNTVFEILTVVEPPPGDDWLYVSSGGGGGGGENQLLNTRVNKALHAALDGDLAAAADLLDALPQDYVATAPLVQRLRSVVAVIITAGEGPSSLVTAAAAFRDAVALKQVPPPVAVAGD